MKGNKCTPNSNRVDQGSMLNSYLFTMALGEPGKPVQAEAP